MRVRALGERLGVSDKLLERTLEFDAYAVGVAALAETLSLPARETLSDAVSESARDSETEEEEVALDELLPHVEFTSAVPLEALRNAPTTLAVNSLQPKVHELLPS